MSEIAAEIIISKVRLKKQMSLGLATGNTPLGIYKELIRNYNNQDVSFKQVCTINLDEYVGLTREDQASYHHYMYENLFKHIDLPLKQTYLPNGAAIDLKEECKRYDQIIEKTGGIDLQLLGIGANGHIGFNEPGTSFSTKTHIVDLTTSTLQANAKYFKDQTKQPTKAITMGISSILKSKEILLLASGKSKAQALQDFIHGEITEEMPATSLRYHSNVTVIADKDALQLVNLNENELESIDENYTS